MATYSTQDTILAASNRKEIIKICRQQDALSKVPSDALEKKLKEVSEIAKNTARISKSKLEMQINVEEQRRTLQELLLKARERPTVAQTATKENLETATRLIEKINYMRKLALIMLSHSDIGTEYVLAVSRDLIEEKTLQSYRRK